MPRILVIDDDRVAADMLVEIFRFHRLDARAAYGGVQALAVAESYQPTVVIMDPRMPGMNGCAIAAALREQTAGTPLVVALTACPDGADMAAARAAAFHRHLRKPVDVDEMLRVVAGEVHVQPA